MLRTTPTILALAGDPGGAAALTPVLKKMRSSNEYRVIVCAYAQAFKAWQTERLCPFAVHDFSSLLAQADLLLTATSVNEECIELSGLLKARELGIPSLSVLDFWSNYQQRFTNRFGQIVLPNRIAIMDELALREMSEAGIPPEILIITGQPAFDQLQQVHESFSTGRRKSLRKEVGVDENECMVLFVSQPFADIYGTLESARETLGFDEGEVLALCSNALADMSARHSIPLTLAIRPHPREQAKKFQTTHVNLFRVAIWETQEYLEALLSADLVMGMNSVLLYEAALMECNVISVQPRLKVSDPLPSNRDGTSVAVYAAEELEPTLEKWLYNHKHSCPTARVSTGKTPRKNATANVLHEINNQLQLSLHSKG